MFFLFFLLVLSLVVEAVPFEQPTFSSLVNEANYYVALTELVNGAASQEDGTKGTVWFDTSSCELENYGFPLIGLYGTSTEKSYNYLDSLSGLGELAIDQGNHGDFVYIMYRFLYAESLKGAENPRALLIEEMTKELNPAFNDREGGDELTAILASTSSTDALKEMYFAIGSPKAATMVSLSLLLSAEKDYSG